MFKIPMHISLRVCLLLWILPLGCGQEASGDAATREEADMRPGVRLDLGRVGGDMRATGASDMTLERDQGAGADQAASPRDMSASQGDLALVTMDMRAGVDLSPPGGDMADGAVMDPGMGLSTQGRVETMEMTLLGRAVPVTVYRPVGAGPFPLVAFHHGFNLDPSLYASYGTHLASWGVMVAMPKMPGSLFAPTSHRDLAKMLLALVEALTASGLADPAKVALAGHSLGGKVAFLAAATTTTVLPLQGVFGIDAVDAIPPTQPAPNDAFPSVAPELMGALSVPMVSLGERVDATCSGAFCQACAPQKENFSQYYEGATMAPALEVEIKGADHMDFLDNPNCGFACSVCSKGTIDPAVARLLTRRLLTAFTLVHLQGRVAYKGWLGGQEFRDAAAAGQVVLRQKNGF